MHILYIAILPSDFAIIFQQSATAVCTKIMQWILEYKCINVRSTDGKS